jgi:hypothetical protein
MEQIAAEEDREAVRDRAVVVAVRQELAVIVCVLNADIMNRMDAECRACKKSVRSVAR